MSLALIATGTELLKGTTVNTNAAHLGRELTAHGLRQDLILTCDDSVAGILRALGTALQSADTVLLSGGLGPTRDDRTLAAVCRFFQLELQPDPELEAKIIAYWQRRHTGRPPKRVMQQACLPIGGTKLDNNNGSAPGILIETVYDRRRRTIVLLPGPPREFEPMVSEQLMPLLCAMRQEREYTAGFLAAGMPEYALQVKLEKTMPEQAATLAYCAGAEGTRVFFRGSDEAAVRAAAENARIQIGGAALPLGTLTLVPEIARLLEERHLSLVTAESCTGGGIGAELTDFPGISAVFQGGAIVYSNELKHRLLGVPEELLARYGAVSAECAAAMVAGACRELAADCAVAVTGIAGPGGGSAEKPVGLVYIGARAGEKQVVREFNFSGDRRTVRERTRAAALLMLRELLSAE